MGWTRFVVVRMAVFSLAMIGAAVVLGISVFQTTIFEQNSNDRPFVIFAIIVASLTILLCMGLSARYSLFTHIGAIAFLAILWLALASYTTDRVGYIQCESLDGQTRPAKISGNPVGTYSAVSWCRQLKAIMAFSWFVWGLFMIAIISWIRLSEHEENNYGEETRHERHEDRAVEENENANNKFNRREALENGYPINGAYGNGMIGNGLGGGGMRYVQQQQQPFLGQQQYTTAIPLQQGLTGGANYIQQQPGHAIVVQGGQVTQVPTGVPIQTIG